MNVDFTRHIVNPILSKFIDVKKSEHVKILGEIRKFLGEMEEKYKFSIYGGDPSRLSEFLASSDFDVFAKIFKNYGLKEVLINILEETRETYKDSEEVVKASSLRLKELGSADTHSNALLKQVLSPDMVVILLKNKFPNGEIIAKGNVVSVRVGDKFFLKIRLGKKTVEVNVRLGFNVEDYSSVLEEIEKIVERLK